MHFTLLLTLFAAVSQVVLANGKHRCRNGQLRCNNNLVEQCHSNRYHMVHMCDPGLKCVIQGDGNAEHFTCDPAKRVRSIETEAKAIDVTSRQRHSDVASTGEIEATTTDEPCEPGSRACDKERRFFFKCTEQGSWGEALQCWKPGACQKDRYQELGCTGYPFFDGKNNECDSYCEGYAWLFCLGVSISMQMESLTRELMVCRTVIGILLGGRSV